MADLIDAKEAAKILGVSRQWVTKLIRTKKLEAEQVSGVWVIERSKVEDYKQRRQGRKGE